jgi:methionyl aminopeptidase
MTISIKNNTDIEYMRISCQLAGLVLDYITPFVQPGVSTNQLDKLCNEYIINQQQAYPSPLNYQPSPNYSPYPKSICTSVNNEVCHGIPSDRILKQGDIVNIDVTVYKNGYHGDTSRMYYVGEVSTFAKRLCQVTYECMWLGIMQVKPGNHLGNIGFVIAKHALNHGYSVVEEFCGHGIGKIFHEDPQILHYGNANTGIKMEAGMIFTIEPMINQGKKQIKFLADGWTAVTKDRSLSAQWEHTILVTDSSYEVLTISPNMPKIPEFVK